MAWQPHRDTLNHIVKLLESSTVASKGSDQLRELERFNQMPEFTLYLLHVLSSRHYEGAIRMCAGILLKNYLSKVGCSPSDGETLAMKNEIVKLIADPDLTVRRTAGMVISALIGVCGFKGWPGVMEFLVNCLDQQDANIVDGAFSALEKICEDYTHKLDSEKAGRPLNYMFPKLLHHFKNPVKDFRLSALNCITKFLHSCPNQMVVNMSNFLDGFFYLANDPDLTVRKRVVAAFLILTETHPTTLTNYFPKLVEFILFCMRQENTELAIQATEFWGTISTTESLCVRVLTPFLDQILPTILTRMMYTQQDLLDLGDVEEDAQNAHVIDSSKDINPSLKPSHVRGGVKDAEDEDDEAYDIENNHNLRKCAADALDSLAKAWVSDSFLQKLLPLIEQGIQSPDWLTRECSILALGCIARGSYHDMKPFLPNLVPFLFNFLRDRRPLIRSITCWCLARYAKWILNQPEKEKYANRLIAELLTTMLDKHKRVQRGATAALVTTVEAAGSSIFPYSKAILETTEKAFSFYQKSNIAFLYDLIGSLSESLGHLIVNEELLRLMLPPLLTRWDSLKDDDTDIFPLLECLNNVSVALGPAFAPYSTPIFGRCLKLIESVLLQDALSKQDKSIDPPDHNFLICSIDLLSGVVEALGRNVEGLIVGSKFVPLLLEVCKIKDMDYNQSVFALIGDIARNYHECLIPILGQLVPLLIDGMDPQYQQACNNAVWALGELLMKTSLPQIIDQFSDKVLSKLFSLANVPGPLVAGTSSVAICRIGLFRPEIVLPHISVVLKSICISLRALEDDVEKEDGIKGLCAIVRGNPAVVLPQFPYFAEALGSYYDPPDDLKTLIGTVLHAYKKQIPPQNWEGMWEAVVESTREYLEKTYNL